MLCLTVLQFDFKTQDQLVYQACCVHFLNYLTEVGSSSSIMGWNKLTFKADFPDIKEGFYFKHLNLIRGLGEQRQKV